MFCGMTIAILVPTTIAAQAVSLTFFNSQSSYDMAVSADSNLARTDVVTPADGVTFVQPADISIFARTTNDPLEGRDINPTYLTNLSGNNSAIDQLIITSGVNVRALGFTYLVGLPGTNPVDSFTSQVFFQGIQNTVAEQTNVGGSTAPGARDFFFGVITDMPLDELVLISLGGGSKSFFQFEFIKDISYATTTSISAVPIPAALPLYGSALAIMGFIGWRRKRKLT